MKNLYFIKFGDLEMGGAIYCLVCAETKEKARLLVSGLDRSKFPDKETIHLFGDDVIEVGKMKDGDIKFVMYYQ